MNKKIVIILIICFLIMCGIDLMAKRINLKSEIKKENSEYEDYLNKEITGTDLATLMNKAINSNEINNVNKDEKNHYIENNSNSIKIEIKMTENDNTYLMEQFYNKGITEFVKLFGEISFKCTNIEYHNKTGRIKKITFEEISP